MTPRLNCADVEELLADYVDQTLLDRDVADLKAHFATCPGCAAMAADAMAAVSFMERAAVVEAPPQLVNKILFEIGNNTKHEIVKPSSPAKWLPLGISEIVPNTRTGALPSNQPLTPHVTCNLRQAPPHARLSPEKPVCRMQPSPRRDNSPESWTNSPTTRTRLPANC